MSFCLSGGYDNFHISLSEIMKFIWFIISLKLFKHLIFKNIVLVQYNSLFDDCFIHAVQQLVSK